MAQQEQAQISVVRCDTPFELFTCSYVTQRFAPHIHETYSVGVIERGASRLRYRGRDVTFAPGDVITIEPDEVHTGEPADRHGWSYAMLYLPKDLMSRLGADGEPSPRFAHARYADAELAAELHAFVRLQAQDPDPLRQGSALAAVLHRLCERHAERGPGRTANAGSAALSRVRDYMEAHFAHPVTVGDLATLAGLSPFHLIRQFRRVYGLPPYAFFEQIRLAHARTMIREGAAISDVAYAAGYSDQSHMTRKFKRALGVPPGRYSRSYSTPRLTGAPPAPTHRPASSPASRGHG